MADLFGDTAIYASEKLAEAAREVGQRLRVYPRLIEGGKLKKDRADRQIAVMRAIERDYTTAAALDRPLVTARLAAFSPGFSSDDRCQLRFFVEVEVAGQERPRLAECVIEVGGYELAAIIRSARDTLSAMNAAGGKWKEGDRRNDWATGPNLGAGEVA